MQLTNTKQQNDSHSKQFTITVVGTVRWTKKILENRMIFWGQND